MPRLLTLALAVGACRRCRLLASDRVAGRAARRHRAGTCRSAFPTRASSPTATPALMIQEGMRALEREIAALRAEGKNPTRANLPPVYYLAVSGGGDNGAFGAGLLNGWSETGTRPEFKMVTGVSTGALIAPFAFLGPSYDAALREVYTTHDARQHLPHARRLGRAVRRRHGRHVAACRRHRQVCR